MYHASITAMTKLISVQLKRQHSAEPPTPTDQSVSASGKSPQIAGNSPTDSSPQLLSNATYDPSTESKGFDPDLIGSPLKKQRASLSGVSNDIRRSSAETLARGLGFGYSRPPLKSSSDLGPDTNFGETLAESSKEVTKEPAKPSTEAKKDNEDGMQDAGA